MNQNNSYYSRKGRELKLTCTMLQRAPLNFHMKQNNRLSENVGTVHAAALRGTGYFIFWWQKYLTKKCQFVTAVTHSLLEQLENYGKHFAIHSFITFYRAI